MVLSLPYWPSQPRAVMTNLRVKVGAAWISESLHGNRWSWGITQILHEICVNDKHTSAVWNLWDLGLFYCSGTGLAWQMYSRRAFWKIFDHDSNKKCITCCEPIHSDTYTYTFLKKNQETTVIINMHNLLLCYPILLQNTGFNFLNLYDNCQWGITWVWKMLL